MSDESITLLNRVCPYSWACSSLRTAAAMTVSYYTTPSPHFSAIPCNMILPVRHPKEYSFYSTVFLWVYVSQLVEQLDPTTAITTTTKTSPFPPTKDYNKSLSIFFRSVREQMLTSESHNQDIIDMS